MASVSPGYYSFSELLRLASFDLAERAGADYLGGQPDLRRVTVGGLGFDSVEQGIRVPATADKVEISLDGEVVESLDVKLNDEHRAEREYSFATAADADDPRQSSKAAKDVTADGR